MNDGLTDPNYWGALAAVFSFPLALLSFALLRRRSSWAAPDSRALPLAVVACGMASVGVYTTIIDGDPSIYVSLRVITLVFCTLVLLLAAGNLYLHKRTREAAARPSRKDDSSDTMRRKSRA